MFYRNSYIGRDYSASYFSNGEVQLIRKNSGNLTRGPTSCTFFGLICSNASNDHNSLIDALKDQTFSLADGIGGGESVGWGAPTLFDRVVPETGAVTFQAPEKPVSAVLTQPIDVKPANQASTPGSSSTPTDVKPPTPVVPQQGGESPSNVEKPNAPKAEGQTQGSAPTKAEGQKNSQNQTVGQGQTAGTVQNVGTVAAPSGSQAAPASNAASTPPVGKETPPTNQGTTASSSSTTGQSTAGVEFQAPQASPLPPSVQAVSPQDVTAPNQTQGVAVPNTGSPDIQAPNQASIPQTSANPQDGPLGVVAPASIAVPNLPPVAPDGGNGVGTVGTPPGFKPGNVGDPIPQPNSIDWDKFWGGVIDFLKTSPSNLRENEEIVKRAQDALLKGEADYDTFKDLSFAVSKGLADMYSLGDSTIAQLDNINKYLEQGIRSGIVSPEKAVEQAVNLMRLVALGQDPANRQAIKNAVEAINKSIVTYVVNGERRLNAAEPRERDFVRAELGRETKGLYSWQPKWADGQASTAASFALFGITDTLKDLPGLLGGTFGMIAARWEKERGPVPIGARGYPSTSGPQKVHFDYWDGLRRGAAAAGNTVAMLGLITDVTNVWTDRSCQNKVGGTFGVTAKNVLSYTGGFLVGTGVGRVNPMLGAGAGFGTGLALDQGLGGLRTLGCG